jgi:hypothetical protein
MSQQPQPPTIMKVDSVMKDSLAPPPQLPGDARILDLAEYKQAAQTLALAFAEDEVSWYFLDTPDRAGWTRAQKWDLHVKIFEYVVYAHVLKGLVVVAGPDCDCVALW